MGVINQPVPSAHPYGHPEAAGSSNLNGVIFASASRDQTSDLHGLGAGIYVSDQIVNDRALGVRVFIATTSTGSGTLTVKLQNYDSTSNAWYDIDGAATGALADPNDAVISVYPGIGETDYDSDPAPSQVAVSDHLGHVWRVHATVATAAVTFSIGASYLG